MSGFEDLIRLFDTQTREWQKSFMLKIQAEYGIEFSEEDYAKHIELPRLGINMLKEAVKAKKMAKVRWIARASVSLRMAKSKIKGSGEAYHS